MAILSNSFLEATLAGNILILERRELCFYYYPIKMQTNYVFLSISPTKDISPLIHLIESDQAT